MWSFSSHMCWEFGSLEEGQLKWFCYVHVFLFFSFFCLQQKISIPRSEISSELQTFTFYLSNVGRDNPQGSFDCIQQYITRWKQTLALTHIHASLIYSVCKIILLTQEHKSTNCIVLELCVNNQQSECFQADNLFNIVETWGESPSLSLRCLTANPGQHSEHFGSKYCRSHWKETGITHGKWWTCHIYSLWKGDMQLEV